MQSLKIGLKFPWKTFFLVIVCVILGIVAFGSIVPSIGAWLLNGAMVILAIVVDDLILCFTSLTFWAGIGVVGTLWFIAFYRKNYAKRRYLVPTVATQLQAAPLQAGAFQNPPTVAQLIQNKDTEVTSA